MLDEGQSNRPDSATECHCPCLSTGCGSPYFWQGTLPMRIGLAHLRERMTWKSLAYRGYNQKRQLKLLSACR